jgi:hypothetical protein
MLQQEAPSLFGDYRITMGEGGVETVETEYQSV